MPGLVGMGTTYNLPNFVGELFALTPLDTPFLSAIGGLNGGKTTTATEFEWSTYDLRDPSAERQRLEGATAPSAENRVRGVGRNIVEIHQEKASVSYTKQAATGQLSVPNSTGVPGTNAVQSELSWQVQQAIAQTARDVELSFLLGVYNRPTDNTTVRKTRGLLNAIQTNRLDRSTASISAAVSATDTITITHALANGDAIVFDTVGAATGITPGRKYWVVNVSGTASFKVSLTSGGTAITLGTATGISFHKPQTAALNVDSDINALIQLAYDNGGLNAAGTVIMVNSTQKLKVSSAYFTKYGIANQLGSADRNVGGVMVNTIETDFGVLGVMLNRLLPVDAMALVQLNQCNPVFLDVPGKGHFFQEPLAKTGASDEVQIYGEIGLEYGNELAHGLLRGLAI